MKRLVVLLLYIVLINKNTSAQLENYGEELFLTIFGLDSTPSCKLCDEWLSENSEPAPEITTTKLLSAFSDHFNDSQWMCDEENCLCYISMSLGVAMLLMVFVKYRKRRKTKMGFKKIDGLIKTENGKSNNQKVPKLTAERDSAIMKASKTPQTGDILRKTKKTKQHGISKQGLFILKQMGELPCVRGNFDIGTQENCKIVSMARDRSSSDVRVFDLRDRGAIPENVMDALMCIELNCKKHPHQGLWKYGCKIVCDSDIFHLESAKQRNSAQLDDSLHRDTETNGVLTENIQNQSLALDDSEKCEEPGPPCASSSFISNSSSITIEFAQNDSNDEVFDPFSYLDETCSQNTSQMQKYLESSMSWFGGLYSYTTERSFARLNIDDLEQSLLCGMDELEKSLDISEMQRSLSFYGHEADSVVLLAAIYVSKKFMATVRTFFRVKSCTKTDQCICPTDDSGSDVDLTGDTNCDIKEDSI